MNTEKMQLTARQTMGISFSFIGMGLLPATPLLAHEKRFHIPKKTAKPKSQETKTQDKYPSTPQKKILNSTITVKKDATSMILEPGEIVLFLLFLGTFLLFYIKRLMYK